MNIVRLSAADVAAYRALMLSAYELAPDAFTSTAAERAGEPDAWWIKRVADPSGRTAAWGAFEDGSLVGSVAVEFSSKPKTKHKALVIGMYVRADARGKGAARALMHAVLAHCRSRGDVEVVQLTVTDGNDAAISLYASLGFQRFGLEPKAIRSGITYFAKQHLWLDLEAGDAT